MNEVIPVLVLVARKKLVCVSARGCTCASHGILFVDWLSKLLVHLLIVVLSTSLWGTSGASSSKVARATIKLGHYSTVVQLDFRL